MVITRPFKWISVINLGMSSTIQKKRYYVTPSPIGLTLTQNDPAYFVNNYHNFPPLRYVLTKWVHLVLNTSRPGQNGRHLADDISNVIFLNENCGILILIPMKSFLNGPIYNEKSLVQKLSCYQTVNQWCSTLLTHIIRPIEYMSIVKSLI